MQLQLCSLYDVRSLHDLVVHGECGDVSCNYPITKSTELKCDKKSVKILFEWMKIWSPSEHSLGISPGRVGDTPNVASSALADSPSREPIRFVADESEKFSDGTPPRKK